MTEPTCHQVNTVIWIHILYVWDFAVTDREIRSSLEMDHQCHTLGSYGADWDTPTNTSMYNSYIKLISSKLEIKSDY